MLTPIDIQNRTLKTTMGGYNKKDTDEFLATVLENYEALFRENRDLKEKITSLSEGIQYYKQMENTLQKALILAEKTSTETQEAAKTQADAMMKEARAKADALLSETKAQTDAMMSETKAQTDALTSETSAKAAALMKETKAQAEIIKSQAQHELEDARIHVRKLVQSYESYRLQFKKLASSQIELLESENFKIYAPEIDEMNKSKANNDTNHSAYSWNNDISDNDEISASKAEAEITAVTDDISVNDENVAVTDDISVNDENIAVTDDISVNGENIAVTDDISINDENTVVNDDILSEKSDIDDEYMAKCNDNPFTFIDTE